MPQPYDIAILHLEDSPEALRLVAQYPDIAALSFGDGEYLVREDEDSQAIFIVLKGALVVEQASSAGGAAPVILACIMAEPENLALVGEMAYLGTQRRAASVRSSGRTHTLCLAPHHIEGILAGFPGLTRLICKQFSQRLQETDKALRSLQSRFFLAPLQRLGNPGEVLFTQGDPAGPLFQLVAGSLRLDGPDGARMVTPLDLPQGFLEPAVFLAGGRHTRTATVEDMAFLVMVPAANREAWVRCYPELVLEILVRAEPGAGKGLEAT